MSASKNAARFGAALGGVAVGLSALLVGLPASADPGDGGTTKGSITVHAYEQPSSGNIGANNGTELTGVTAKPIVGAEFTACQVDGVNLANEADWTKIKNYTANNTAAFGAEVKNGAVAQTFSNCVGPVATDSNGKATFSNLASDKLWVVYESKAPANAVTVAAPSLVTLPYPGADSTTWNYNVHVYPKNILAGNGATKNSVTVNDNITYTIDVPVQQLYAADGVTKQNYTEFKIEDTLQGDVDIVVSPSNPSVALKNNDTLVKGTDYTLDTSGNAVTLVFTAAGLSKLDGIAGTGNSVVLTIKAKINNGAKIENTAKVTINGKTVDVTDPNPPTVYQGAQVKTLGHNAKAASNKVPVSATLNFYRVKASAKTLASCPADPTTDPKLELVPFDTAATGDYTTNATTGLGDTFTVAADTYCVYTKVAPKGYKTTAAVLWTVTGASDISPVIDYVQLGSENGDLPSLPLTGAAGTMAIIGGGVALLAIGGALVAARRRREASSL